MDSEITRVTKYITMDIAPFCNVNARMTNFLVGRAKSNLKFKFEVI